MPIIDTKPLYDTQSIINCVVYIEDNKKTLVTETEDGRRIATDISEVGEVSIRSLDGTAPEAADKEDIRKLLEYAENVEKTMFSLDDDKQLLVSGYNCSSNTFEAVAEFEELKQNYYVGCLKNNIDPDRYITGTKKGKKDGERVAKQARDAYHLIMSFEKQEGLSPQLVHQIGLEFCEKALGNTKAVVSTHMNTEHLHNHIVFSAYKIDELYKYRDTMEQLESIRHINDEISLKYGVKVLLDRNVLEKEGSWYENKLEKDGKLSWKQEVKNAIDECKVRCDSWEQFKLLMLEKGYDIDDTRKHVLYKELNDPTGKRRVRGKTLGDLYTMEYLRYEFGEITEQEYLNIKNGFSSNKNTKSATGQEKVNNLNNKPKYDDKKYYPNPHSRSLDIYVPRYTVTGRRRSDLELLLLGAKKIVEHFVGKNEQIYRNSPNKYKEANELILGKEQIEKALENRMFQNSVAGFYAKNPDALKDALDDLGAKIFAVKSELDKNKRNLATSSKDQRAVGEILDIRKEINLRGLDSINLHLLSFSEEDVRKNRAKLSPMTNYQRKDLYQSLNTSKYSLICKFDELSYQDGENVINFLKGKTDKRPDFIVTKEEARVSSLKPYFESILKRNITADKNRLQGKELTDNQKALLNRIIKDNPEIDITNVKDAFDFQQIVNFFTDNDPFKDGKRYEGNPISNRHKKDLKALCELYGLSLTLPIEEMTEKEYQKALKHLLYKTVEPECLSVDISNERHNFLFDKELERLSDDDRALMYRYRNKMIELNKLGITEDNLTDVPANTTALAKETNKLNRELVALKYQYGTLKDLGTAVKVATDITNDPDIEQKFTIKPEKEKVVEVAIEDNKTSEPSEETSVQPYTEAIKEEPKTATPTSVKAPEEPKTEVEDAENKSSASTSTPAVDQPAPEGKRAKEVYNKNGIVGILSEDGLRITLHNTSDKPVIANFENTPYKKGEKIRINPDKELSSTFTNTEYAKRYIEALTNGSVTFDIAPVKAKEQAEQPHTEVIKEEPKTVTPTPVKTPEEPKTGLTMDDIPFSKYSTSSEVKLTADEELSVAKEVEKVKEPDEVIKGNYSIATIADDTLCIASTSEAVVNVYGFDIFLEPDDKLEFPRGIDEVEMAIETIRKGDFDYIPDADELIKHYDNQKTPREIAEILEKQGYSNYEINTELQKAGLLREGQTISLV